MATGSRFADGDGGMSWASALVRSTPRGPPPDLTCRDKVACWHTLTGSHSSAEQEWRCATVLILR